MQCRAGFADIEQATGAVRIGSAETLFGGFQGVSVDSRTVREGEIFVAIRGRRFDGHDFVTKAFSKGASGAIVERAHRLRTADHRPIFQVPDTLKALGDLARFHRDRFRLDLAAVTGSSGKSTTKEMLSHLLSSRRRVLATPGTQNNRIGVPLALLRLGPEHEAAVLELGTNQWGEIGLLTQIARPTIGMVTNVGSAHLETFGDLRGVLKAKGELWESMEPDAPVVLNAEDPFLDAAGKLLRRPVIWFGFRSVFGCASGQSRKVPRISAAFRSDTQVWASEVAIGPGGSRCRVNGRWELHLPVAGRHNLLNALGALACAWQMGMDLPDAVARLASFSGLPGRLTPIEADGVLILDDSYNANPASVKAALEVLQDVRRPGRRAFVLGDMLELGPPSEALHAEVGRWVAGLKLDLFVAVGPRSRSALESAWEAGLPREAGRAFLSPAEAGEFVAGWVRAGDVALVKGSRGMKMEQVLECFTTSSIR